MKKQLTTLSIALSLLLGVSGCSTYSTQMMAKKTCSDGQRYYAGHLNYNSIVDEAIASILSSPHNAPEVAKRLKAGDNIIVTDFVDTSSLENQTKLGYVLSNTLKDSLTSKHSFKVLEAEVSKYFKISANGLKILTREHSKIRQSELHVERVMAGTYTYTDEELVVFVKLINLKTGIIEGSYAKTFPMTCQVMEMLND